MIRTVIMMLLTVFLANAQESASVLQAKAAAAGMSTEQIRQKAAEYGVTDIPAAVVTENTAAGESDWTGPDGALVNNNGETEDDDEENVDGNDTLLVNGIRPFGYDIFNLKKSTFEPRDNVTVPDDYLVGPGDELIITVWGETQLHHMVTVQRNGSIVLPNAGLITANGQTISELRETLLNRMSRYYSSLRYGKPGARSFLDVTFGKLKSIRVFVLGEVQKPGGYILSSMSTVFTGLYYAGGATVDGSLREIAVKRGGETVVKVDLYDYLLKGDNSSDIRLENGDIIMVKPIGKSVTLRGEVFRPARYELRDGETFNDLIEYAGGYLQTAYLDRISIKRIIPFGERDAYDNDVLFIDISSADGGTELSDGDEVRVHAIAGLYENQAVVSGAVAMPGEFAVTPGMTVSGLLKKAGGVLGDAFMHKGEIVRTQPDLTRELLHFNVGLALQGDAAHDIALMNLDEVRIYSQNEFRDRDYVAIDGAVRNPGILPLVDSMTLADVILKSGGFTDNVSLVKAIEVYRMDEDELYRYSKEFDVPAVASIAALAAMPPFYLKKYDRIFVRENPAFEIQKTVQMNGEVHYPGVYPIESNSVRISDIIKKAGGLKDDAFLDGFEFRREEKIVFLDLHDILSKAGKGKRSKYDIFLREGDLLTIPQNPHVVKVTGEVMTPAIVLYQKGKGPGYYIEQAGGFSDNADKRRTQVKLANGRVWKKRCLLPDPPLTAGTSIFIPAKPDRDSKFWDTTKNIATIIGSIATTALVIDRIIRDK